LSSTQIIYTDWLLSLHTHPIVQAARENKVSLGIHNGLRAKGEADYVGQFHTRAPHTLNFAADDINPNLSPLFTARHQASYARQQPEVRGDVRLQWWVILWSPSQSSLWLLLLLFPP
jgi:hypothetical protein